MLKPTREQAAGIKALTFDKDFQEAFCHWLLAALAEEDRLNRRTPDVAIGQGRAQILEEVLGIIDTVKTTKS